MHLEVTSRCTLACPACPRTWFSQKFNKTFPKQDLDIDALWAFLDCETGSQVNDFTLNGNHGDAIYYPQLFEFIDRFRSTKRFHIVTNGSFQTPEFYHNLAARLTPNDSMCFSIDGLEHNNHLYRRNSDWKSIMSGLDIMVASGVPVTWKTLIFSYNQSEIADIEKLALSKGCKFHVQPSSRFGEASLMPQEQYVSTERIYKKYQDITLEPQCNTQEYISAQGYYWPCCMISSYYTLHQTVLWKQKTQWTIYNNTLDQLRSKLAQWQNNVKNDPNNAHDVCKMTCKPGQKHHKFFIS